MSGRAEAILRKRHDEPLRRALVHRLPGHPPRHRAFPDERRLRDIRIWEYEDGIIIQSRGYEDSESPYQTFLLSDDDLRVLRHRAYERRHHQAPELVSSED